ncbi:hypothetical protein C8F04DRAFT_1069257 [Mycena alexandri]|uniref:Uncharacterized protein n=1 Tax=Mycena alexandri TaxID=1745969 RepID=A0AAD6XCC8_9AGAR|nr:hypothetical protein C8F04DRAFT_1069257 [Mycena alexandri]
MSKIRAITLRRTGDRLSVGTNSNINETGTRQILVLLNEGERHPLVQSLQIFVGFKSDIHLGLVFYNELSDITFYWDSLAPLERAIVKHRFLLDYLDAGAYAMAHDLFGPGLRSHGVFPRPSPPTSRLLTLVNVEGSLRMYIVPDGEQPLYHPLAAHTECVTRPKTLWLQSEVEKPSAEMTLSNIQALALAMYRILMVASGGSQVSGGLTDTDGALGALVVMNSARAFWESTVQFRHHPITSASEPRSYKWTWHDDSMKGIYHGIPGWTRFTLNQKGYRWISRAATIVFGDQGSNVDNWSVFLSALMNWNTASPEFRTFCLERCAGNTQVGFVTGMYFSATIEGKWQPLAGYDAADTVYFFLENLRVEADGYVHPCRQYYSLDRMGETPMSEGLKTIYGLDRSEIGCVGRRKYARSLSSEQFAVLEELRIRFGETLRTEAPGVWRDCWYSGAANCAKLTILYPHLAPSPLKRSQSLTRLVTKDWRNDWMMEGISELAGVSPWRMGWKGHQLQAEIIKARKNKSPIHRLHRSKTKSVGGGLSLIFSRLEL